MTDWLVPLLQIGGFGAVVAIALFIMGKWLLGQITIALNSYVTAYAQETAKIDARIERLEKLAEEQARLTRTVETIKDEIAAQAKSRDNRWGFRKEVYVNLTKSVSDLLRIRGDFLVLVQVQNRSDATNTAAVDGIHSQKAANLKEYRTRFAEFMRNVCVAHLATADRVFKAASSAASSIRLNLADDTTEERVTNDINVFAQLLGTLAHA